MNFTSRSIFFKKISAVLALVVFILAITPKITLHNWFANHKDATPSRTISDKPILNKAGFNCKCDNLVAEGHFIAGSNIEIVNPQVVYSFSSYYLLSFTSVKTFYDHLRGPPLQF